MQEESGESLFTSEMDEEDISEDANVRAEDEGGSEDGFLVPDGYLSENEVLFDVITLIML